MRKCGRGGEELREEDALEWLGGARERRLGVIGWGGGWGGEEVVGWGG